MNAVLSAVTDFFVDAHLFRGLAIAYEHDFFADHLFFLLFAFLLLVLIVIGAFVMRKIEWNGYVVCVWVSGGGGLND